MAENIKIHRLTNANIFIDGGSMLGRAESFASPTVVFKQAEHRAMGMVGTVEYMSGIDKMEGTIKWNSYYPEAMTKMANPYQAVRLQIRGNIEEYSGGSKVADKPATIYMTVTPKNFPTGSFTQHDNVEIESSYGCTYLKVVVDGTIVTEIDVEANIFKVNGTDLLAAYRQNLGI